MENGEKIKGSNPFERGSFSSGKSRGYPLASVYEDENGVYAVLDGKRYGVLLDENGNPVTKENTVLKGIVLITLIIKNGALKVFRSVFWRNQRDFNRVHRS